MEESRVLYRLVVTVMCFVCLGFSSVGVCSESDALIKTYVSSQRSDEVLGALNLKVPSITVDDWDLLVLDSKVPVMVLFIATWRGSCGEMSLILDQLDSEYKGIFKFYTVDVINDKFIQDQYSVRDLPTTIIFKDGENIASFTGPLSAERLRELVEQYL